MIRNSDAQVWHTRVIMYVESPPSLVISIAHDLSLCVECELYIPNLGLSQIGTYTPAKDNSGFSRKRGSLAVSLLSSIGADLS